MPGESFDRPDPSRPSGRRASGRRARDCRRLTVQAPQTPCSQPTCVPVAPICAAGSQSEAGEARLRRTRPAVQRKRNGWRRPALNLGIDRLPDEFATDPAHEVAAVTRGGVEIVARVESQAKALSASSSALPSRGGKSRATGRPRRRRQRGGALRPYPSRRRRRSRSRHAAAQLRETHGAPERRETRPPRSFRRRARVPSGPAKKSFAGTRRRPLGLRDALRRQRLRPAETPRWGPNERSSRRPFHAPGSAHGRSKATPAGKAGCGVAAARPARTAWRTGADSNAPPALDSR